MATEPEDEIEDEMNPRPLGRTHVIMRSDSGTLASLRNNSKGKRVITPDTIRDMPQGSRGTASKRRYDKSPDLREAKEESRETLFPADFAQVMIHWYRHAKRLGKGEAADSCTFAQFRKADPPEYDGKLDPLEANGWIRKMEWIFRVENVHDDQKVNFATLYLEGEAAYWWEGIRPALGGKDATISWKDFTEAFNAQYFPKSFQVKMRSDFVNISQGNSTVMEYAARFNHLSRFMESVLANEELRAEHFQRGLQSNIRTILTPLVLTTYKDVFDRAIRVEQDILESSTQDTPQNKRFKLTDYQDSHTSGSRQQRDFNRLGMPINKSYQGPCTTCGRHHVGPCYCKTGACFLCGKMGHIARECPTKRDVPVDSRVCFVCGQPGHLARNCFMRKNAP